MTSEGDREPMEQPGFNATVLDAIGAMVVVIDQNGSIVYANRACRQLTGYGMDEMKGQLWDRFAIPEEAEAARAVFRSLTAGQVPSTHENHWLIRCGAPRLFAWSYTALLDGDGGGKYVIGTGTDMTEQRRNERALSDVEERFRKLTENIPEVFFVRDLGKKNNFYVSPRYETIWGRSAQAMLEDPEDFINGVHPDDRERVIAAYRGQTLDSPFNEEYRVVRPDGGLRWIHARTYPIFNEAGEFYRVACVAEDITERKHSEQALRDSESRLRQIVDLVPHMIFAKDWDGRFLLVNKAKADAYGMTVEQLTGRYQRELLAGSASTAQIQADDREVMASGRRKRIAEETFVDVAGNERILETIKVPYVISDGDGPAVLGVAADITERRRMAQELADEAERYRLVVNTLAEAVVLIGADGRFLAGNASAARIVGVEPDNLVGRPFFPQSRLRRIDGNGQAFPLERHPIAMTLRTGQAFTDVVMGLVREDDTVLWLSINTRPTFRGGDPTPDAAVVSLMDITAQRNAESALATSEERLRQAVRVSGLGILDHDHRTGEIYRSPEQRAIYGLGPSEALGISDFLTMVHPEDSAAVAAAFKRAHDPASDGDWDMEYRILRRDGAIRWMRSRAHTFFEGEGAARHPVRTIGAVLDITEQKEGEALRLRQSIDYRETLISEVHHRIKNNLQGMIGLLRQEVAERPELRPAIERAIHRMRAVALVHGLEGQSSDKEIGLRDVLRESVQGMSGTTPASLVLDLNVTDRWIARLAPGEAVAVALVINELLTNAVKHSEPRSGSCEITLTTRSDRVTVILVNAGGLPADFDYANSHGIGTGLGLTKALLPRSGAGLCVRAFDDQVRVELNLFPPVVSIREKTEVGSYG